MAHESQQTRLPWTAEEDAILISLVERYGEKRWNMVANGLPGRTGKGCSHRWRTYLRPDVKHPHLEPFTEWEAAVIVQAQRDMGNNWLAIAKLLLPGRSNTAVKNFWHCRLKSGSGTHTNRLIMEGHSLRYLLNEVSHEDRIHPVALPAFPSTAPTGQESWEVLVPGIMPLDMEATSTLVQLLAPRCRGEVGLVQAGAGAGGPVAERGAAQRIWMKPTSPVGYAQRSSAGGSISYGSNAALLPQLSAVASVMAGGYHHDLDCQGVAGAARHAGDEAAAALKQAGGGSSGMDMAAADLGGHAKEGPAGHPEEDQCLKAAVTRYGVKRWAQIAALLPGRTSKACSHRWRTYLQPGVMHTSTNPFTEWEVAVVKEAHKVLGNNWSAIARMLPGRTNAAVKNFWYAHKRRSQRARRRSHSSRAPGITASAATNPAAATSAEVEDFDCADVDIDYLEGDDMAALDLVAEDEVHEEDEEEDEDHDEEQEEAAAAGQMFGIMQMNAAGFHQTFTEVNEQKGENRDDDQPVPSQHNQLEATIKRKSRQVEAALAELGIEGLEERLSSATQNPASPAYKLSRLVAEGRAVIVVEVTRATPATTPQQLAQLAKAAIQCGADALCVRLDSEDTPQGLQDLFAVVQASKRTPVIARDWIIHPLQLVEAKEAGAAGVLGVIGQVNGRGTAVMSSFAAAIGLDAPVEVVNALEMDGLARTGVVFYGINLSVGLSVAVPGFASDMAHGLLGEMPFGTISLVGVRNLEQARKARMSGADALLIKKEMIEEAQANGKDLRTLLDQVLYVTSGDD
eukprot:gene9698-9857_t